MSRPAPYVLVDKPKVCVERDGIFLYRLDVPHSRGTYTTRWRTLAAAMNTGRTLVQTSPCVPSPGKSARPPIAL